MDGVLLEVPPSLVWEADLLASVVQLRQEVAQLRAEVTCLQRDNLELRQQAGYWQGMHAKALKRLAVLEQENEHLRGENRKLQDQLFGRKSEQKPARDRSNDLEDPDEPAAAKRKRGQQPGRSGPKRRDYTHLPAREEVHDLPEGACVCPRCRLPLVAKGDTEDSTQIEIEVRAYRRVIRRKRYRRVCTCADLPHTFTAPAPPKLLPKSLYGTSVWLEILLAKFANYQPTERLLTQWRWLEIDLAAGTVADGLRRLEPLFAPLWEALRTRNRASGYHQADETRWLVFIEQEGKNGHRWWLWVFLSADTVVYELDPSRSHVVPDQHLPAETRGVMLVDRYAAYKAMAAVKAGLLLLAFCWAHVRRDFIRDAKGYPELKTWALAWLRRIRNLYRLNGQRLEQTPDTPAYVAAQQALRQAIAVMQEQRDLELADPKLRQPCCKTLASLEEHWPGLTRFVDDPRIPMDNNASERRVRGPALGRKNYYGSGSLWSGRLAAMLFSIFATLDLAKLNPRAWLRWYLDRCAAAGGQAPEGIDEFLPWNLTRERRAALSPSGNEPVLTTSAQTATDPPDPETG
ncbi:MAG TPA: IS66 family transposase [Gemmataceae bacterium]|jgi:transposase|nr:IS66 family transposase [Gemmataceae bacterium]